MSTITDMPSPRWVAWLASVAAIGAALTPGGALAASRFVTINGSDAANNCLSSANPCRHVAYAATQAADGDTVSIGAGQFSNENVSITTAKRVFFAGASSSFDPSLGTAVNSSNANPAFDLRGGGGISSLRVAPSQGSPTGPSVSLEGAAPAGVLRSFVIDDVAMQHSLGALGVKPGASGSVDVQISNSKFVGPSFDYALLDVSGPGASVTVRDTSFTDPGNDGAMLTANRASVRFERVIGNELYGLIVTGGTLDIERSQILTNGGYALSLESNTVASGAAVARVTNSVLALNGPSSFSVSTIEQSTINNGLPSQLDLVGSTVVKRAPTADEALQVRTEAPTSAGATLVNTAVRSINTGGSPAATDIKTIGPGNGSVAASFSSFTNVSGNVTAPGIADNVIGDPQFTDVAGKDYTLAPGSPLVDRGSPSAAVGPLDVIGNPRSSDGNGDCIAVPDIGAFERPGACPALSFALAARKVKVNRKGKGTLPFTCGAPAGQTCTVLGTLTTKQTAPRAAKKRKPKRVGTVSGAVARGQTGRLALALNGRGKKLIGARHKLKAALDGTVSDQLGQRSALASTLRIKLTGKRRHH